MTGPVFLRDTASTAFALRLITELEIHADDVDRWSDKQIRAAEDWAGAVHLAKTLSDITVPAMPAFLRPFARTH